MCSYLDSTLLAMLLKLIMKVIRNRISKLVYLDLGSGSSALKRRKRLILFILIFMICGFIPLFINTWNGPDGSKVVQSSLIHQGYPDLFERERDFLEHHKITEHILKKGETLCDCLATEDISPDTALEYTNALKKYLNLKSLKPGDYIRLFMDKNTNVLKKLIYRRGNEEVLTVIKTPLGMVTSRNTKDYVKHVTSAWGTVNSTLYEAGLKKGVNMELILELADIFAWDVDFATDIRPNDTFKFIYEEYYRDGKLVRNGRILAAEFVNAGIKHEAFYFEDKEGHKDYYDTQGRCLRKHFLRSPLRYKRISSYFSRRRFHPILRIYRPHLGIDYAAPVGTPVESVGDGRIEFIGWKGDYGKFIRIRHNHNYVTTYGHLSRFARGLKRGQRVKQGQLIGYVGSTGLATGPHLDFRMIHNGIFVNHLKIKSPPAAPVKKRYLDAFNTAVLRLRDQLETIAPKVSAATEKSISRGYKGG